MADSPPKPCALLADRTHLASVVTASDVARRLRTLGASDAL